MKSPFPGMDPYLQQHWRDVHTSLVTYARDQLQPILPPGLVARAEKRVYLASEEELDRSFYPDVYVAKGKKRIKATDVSGDVELAEPIIITLDDEPLTERFLEVREAGSGNRVITTIEFISPTNKIPGEGFRLYRQKQRDAEKAGVSLVEIDLVLGGKRVLSVPLGRIPYRDRTRYQAIIRRGWKWHEAEVYPLPLNKKLPIIPIPLRTKDRDARINLQMLVNRAYEMGAYDTIDYHAECDPPLEGPDAEWADALLRAAGKRK